MVPEGRTALYRFFNADDELLYVGIAVDPAHRWKEHCGTKPWAHEVTMRVIEWLPSRNEALAAELLAIQIEKPRYNIRNSPHKLSPNLLRPSMRNLEAKDVEKAAGYLAIQDVAELIDASRKSVSAFRWASKPGRTYANDPFPAQDSFIAHHPVWSVDRISELRKWRARHPSQLRQTTAHAVEDRRTSP